MVDRDLLLRKVAQLDTYLSELAADLADHLVADHRLPVPETGAQTSEILGRAGLLPVELAGRLARMVGFRNILVHDYARIEPALVIHALREDVRDVQKFRDAVLGMI